jgi:hypothetical protein
MSDFIIVTYWWDGTCMNSAYDHLRKRAQSPVTYETLVERLRRRCARLGIRFDAIRIAAPDYQTGISLKPIVIDYMLSKWNVPVFYVDCDMVLHKYPRMLSHTSFDFMAFNWYSDCRATSIFDWHTLFSSGGLLFFNTTDVARRLLRLWKWSVLLDIQKADDRMLDMCFLKLKYQLKYYWFPVEYCYIPRYMRLPDRRIIISHPFSLTENFKSRLPIGYVTHMNKVLTNGYTHVIEYIPIDKKKWLDFVYYRNKSLREKGVSYKVVFT